MNWDDLWKSLGFTIVLAAAVLGLASFGNLIFQDKNVDYYYLSHQSQSPGVCVYAHWTWHGDEVAYCGETAQALDFVAKANATLHAK
jgi:hypothetical protein